MNHAIIAAHVRGGIRADVLDTNKTHPHHGNISKEIHATTAAVANCSSSLEAPCIVLRPGMCAFTEDEKGRGGGVL